MIRAKTKMVLMTTAALTLPGWRLNQEASPGKHNERMLLPYATCELSFSCKSNSQGKVLSPGQTDSQVDASGKLGSTCDSVRPGLYWGG